MADKKNITRKRRPEKVVGECFFCKEKKNPSFLEFDVLSKYTSERGKIHSRVRTGICSKHQRKLTTEVKRARYLAFLPFVVRPE
ncbi:MAG TPA: 30S ribosomal protein S18 [Patescibacteria group bacterium]|nr:30S ribosomal protein S18 [Patescibacteria group bacterium]